MLAASGSSSRDARGERAQLAVIASLLERVDVSTNVALLNGAFTSWIEDVVGVRSSGELFPSVRFAVESAVAVAVAASAGKTLSRVMTGDDTRANIDDVSVNGLVDATTDVDAARREARSLVDAGYACLKVKVARGAGREGARADAERLAAIRREVGPDVVLRADANRGWDLSEALDFGARVQELGVGLQYVEEPTRAARESAAFHFTEGVPVALDETIDDILRESTDFAAASAAIARVADRSAGIVAVVLKPSVVGGIEATASVARIAASRGARPTLSSAFESGVGLSVIGHLAATLDGALREDVAAAKEFLVANDDTERPRAMDVKPLILELGGEPRRARVRHGDVVRRRRVGAECCSRAGDEGRWRVHGFTRRRGGERDDDARVSLRRPRRVVGAKPYSSRRQRRPEHTTSSAWTRARATRTRRCLFFYTVLWVRARIGTPSRAVSSRTAARASSPWIYPRTASETTLASSDASSEEAYSIEAMRDVVASVARALGCRPEKTRVVGYSMGARVALALDETIAEGFIAVGGSPGVRGDDARRARAARDDDLADALRRADDVREFSEVWYRQGLFSTPRRPSSIRRRRRFAARRGTGADARALAACVSAASPGRQVDGWLALDRFRGKLALVVGEEDAKFTSLATKM